MKSSILLLTFSDPLAENLRKDPRYPEAHFGLYGGELNLSPPNQKPDSLLDDETVKEYSSRLREYFTHGAGL